MASHRFWLIPAMAISVALTLLWMPLAAAAASSDAGGDPALSALGRNLLSLKGETHSGQGDPGSVEIVCYPGQPLSVAKFW